MVVIKYIQPLSWINFQPKELYEEHSWAKGAVLALTKIRYSKIWAEKLQEMQLKREIAGTTKIEGADFAPGELEKVFNEPPGQLFTRSQRQAKAAKETYRWIATLKNDVPINKELILEIHRRIVQGADDCPTGAFRSPGDNVTFGIPIHRGAEGGYECENSFNALIASLNKEYREHDLLLQALALHYHFAAIHPFRDGNGRTARALEALVLQRAGLKDLLFIAMSNYYYEEKAKYLEALSETRSKGHDLTPFLKFGLKGIILSCGRLLDEINIQISKALFRDVMHQLFGRLRSRRKKVLADRQVQILQLMLEMDKIELNEFMDKNIIHYSGLKRQLDALIRDVNGLLHLDAIRYVKESDKGFIVLNLEWPTQITETDFLQKVKEMPKLKGYPFS